VRANFYSRRLGTDPSNSNKAAYTKITSYIQKAKDAGGEILIGGTGKFLSLRGSFFL